MKLTRHFPRAIRHYRVPIIVIAVFAPLAIYIGVSVWVWSEYRGAYTNWKSSSKEKIDTVLSLPQKTANDQTKWLQALESAVKSSQIDPCTMSGLYLWQQTIIPGFKQHVSQCNDLKVKQASLTTVLKEVTTNIQAEQQMTAIVAEPLKASTVAETDYQAQKNAWTIAVGALNGVVVTPDLLGTKTSVISASKGIEVAWSDVIAANVAQNASGYEDALAKLTSAYKTLQTSQSQSKKDFQTMGDMLQKAYNNAF